jgi:hypothetical protein
MTARVWLTVTSANLHFFSRPLSQRSGHGVLDRLPGNVLSFDDPGPCHTFPASWIGLQIDAPVISEADVSRLHAEPLSVKLRMESDG